MRAKRIVRSLIASFPPALLWIVASPPADSLAAAAPPAAASRYEARFPGTSPEVAFDGAGRLHVAYAAEHAGATDQVLVRTLGPALSPPVAVTGRVALEASGEVGPVIAALPGNALVVVYALTLPGGGWRSELLAQRSADGGRTWQPPRRVHDDAQIASHSYAAVAVNRRGLPVVSWLDKRSGHQGVRAAVLDLGGPRPNRSVDDVTCECCRTAMLAAADGTLWSAYRDLATGNVRNIAFATSRDEGATFVRGGDVAADNWSLSGCPDSGPRLAQAGDGAVWATWFNGERKAIEVAAARRDRFGPAQVVATASGEVALVNHPEIGTFPDGRLVVFYEIAGAGRAVVMRVADATGGRWGAPVELARDAARPRYARAGSRAVLAYSSHGGDAHTVVLVDGAELVKRAAGGGR